VNGEVAKLRKESGTYRTRAKTLADHIGVDLATDDLEGSLAELKAKGNKSAKADLSWQIWQDKDGLHAEARNSGLRHAKISALTLHRADGQTIRMSEGLAGYVLGGAIRRFDLKATDGSPRLVAGEKLSITAQNDSLTIQGQALAETR
jgi:hypothetical protein